MLGIRCCWRNSMQRVVFLELQIEGGNMVTNLRNVIATRKLINTSSDRKQVFIRIAKPRKVSATEWECAYHISDIGMDEIGFGHGIDSLQALIHAIEGVRVILEKSKNNFSWEGGEDDDPCIPRYVPMFYGKNFTERISKLIDSEIETFAKSAERQREG
jgi:hypothetical protein